MAGVAVAERSRWGRVLHEEDWRASLEELAGSYYYCVYAWWRRDGLAPAETAEATVATFSRWLAERRPMLMDSGATSMREWAPQRLAELERNGIDWEGEPALRIDPEWAEQRYEDEPPGDPDAIFHRRWGLTVLEFSVTTLRAEYSARGEEELFPELLPFAGFTPDEEDRYTAAAERLGRTRGAMRKLVYDFRQRQRELLLDFIGDTLADPAAAEQEVTALLIACDLPGGGSSAARLPSAIANLHPDQMLSRAMKSVRMTGGASGFWKPPTVEEAARLFPQYEVRALLGHGGMGAVYQGRQKELDRLVAIKLLPLEVSVDRSFAERFRREARAMAKLQHPNIVDVHDFGTTREGHLYFVMEYVEGANLEQMIKGPGLEPAQALEIIGSVCEALAYAHAEGVVHRDIKPANVMVSTKGEVKVADFGLARLTEPLMEPRGYTVTGTVLGTPDYMAPEQKRGQTVDHRADIYSLGVMLYEMLCREVPQGIFDPPSKRVAVDTRVDEVVMKAMQQQPEKRFQTSTEMQTAVTRARAPQPLVIVSRGNLAPARMQRARLAQPKRKSPVFTLLFLAALGTAGFLWYAQYGKKMIETAVSGTPAPASAKGIAAATKEAAFVNSLGMKFVPVPIIGGPTAGQRVLFSVWDTRVQDYAVFARETNREWPQPDFEQGPTHPATCVSWNDAVAFCAWVTERERKAGRLGAREEVRLPSDHEWSCAVGIGELEDAAMSPLQKDKLLNVYPWGGTTWPPPDYTGNYLSVELKTLLDAGKAKGARSPTDAYRDGFGATAPVGSYAANRFGLFDMGGNVWQWCGDLMGSTARDRVIRGAHWADESATALSSKRWGRLPTRRERTDGFRCVIAPVADHSPSLVAPVLSQQKRATPPPAPPPAAERWEDLLAPLTPEVLAATGRGWRMEGGRLLAPYESSVPLYIRSGMKMASYRLRFKLGRVDDSGATFVMKLPVTDHSVRFFLDFDAGKKGVRSGLERADGVPLLEHPQSVQGGQFTDTVPHELELAVRTVGGSATVLAWLDRRPFYQWTGPVATLPEAASGGRADTISLQASLKDHGGGWFLSEAKLNPQAPAPDEWQKLLASFKPAAKPAPVAVPGQWEDLLAGFTPEVLAKTGNGWYREGSGLRGPKAGFRTLQLPGDFAGATYHVRVKLRRVAGDDVFHVVLPVGDRVTAFELDGNKGTCTAVQRVDGKIDRNAPGAVEGRQIKDGERHELEVNVRLRGANVTITSLLDSKPLHLWAGPIASLSHNPRFVPDDAGRIALAAAGDEWLVLEARAMRVDTSAPEVTVAPSSPSPAVAAAAVTNFLGMKFVPVPIVGGPTAGQRVLFSVWDTRVQDYEVFVKETKREWLRTDFEQGPTHPVADASWEDAQAFCQWLTAREQKAGKLAATEAYRLPSDHEWSCAAGIGDKEDPAKLPVENAKARVGAFPWGTTYPPPPNAGNYADEELQQLLAAGKFSRITETIAGYRDGFATTSPVGSFPPNRFGLFDMSGNVWQYCEDWIDDQKRQRVLRGGAWESSKPWVLISYVRAGRVPKDRVGGNLAYVSGFRCVLGPKPAPPKPATEIERWFTQVDEPQQTAYEKQVVQPFETGLADLRARYLAQLDAALAKASAAGQLADALSYRNERKYFVDEENVPRLDAGVHPAVLALRATFRQQLLKLDQTRLEAAKTLFTAYDASLEKNQALLTQRQRLDEALFVKNKRGELAKLWLTPSPLVEASGAAAVEAARAIAGGASAPVAATRGSQFVNSLGMKLVPLPGRNGGGGFSGDHLLIGVWDTRVQDYQAFVDETKRGWAKPSYEQGPTHPAVNMSWLDAQSFCGWLTDKEQKSGKIGAKDTYRLPSDQEWSRAVGLPPEQGATPLERADKNQTDFPWGRGFPPKALVGNYHDQTRHKDFTGGTAVPNYNDGFCFTSPVGTFPANRYGLFDMGGNVWQWCDDWLDKTQKERVMRGASYECSSPAEVLRSAHRGSHSPGNPADSVGFRCVLSVSGK
jgi:formylglycine-generating enzyme required for sulfatase activity/predicted Ser/Thr protein kinase